MIIKDTSVKIDNLHPSLKALIPKLDALHKKHTSNPLVITSGNDDIHWGGIKEENRPAGWEITFEDEVRVFSDSAHYLDEAFDFRKKCPYSKKTYYHNLNSASKELFLKEVREIFKKQTFDVVECAACLHVERDPKWLKDIPEPRIKRLDYVFSPVPKNVKVERQIVVSELERLWYEVNGRAVILGTVNFLTRKLTGFAFFKDRKDDQSIWGRLLELINIIITKLKGKDNG